MVPFDWSAAYRFTPKVCFSLEGSTTSKVRKHTENEQERLNKVQAKLPCFCLVRLWTSGGRSLLVLCFECPSCARSGYSSLLLCVPLLSPQR